MTQWFLNYVLHSGTILIDLVAYTMVRALKWKIEIWFLIYSRTKRTGPLFHSLYVIFLWHKSSGKSRQIHYWIKKMQTIKLQQAKNKPEFCSLIWKTESKWIPHFTWKLQSLKNIFLYVSWVRLSNGRLKLCIFTQSTMSIKFKHILAQGFEICGL